MNMRDYRGSTPYSEEDVAAYSSPDISVQAAAVRRFGQDVALFVLYVCTRLNIPPITTGNGRKSGGVALATWSMSGIAIISILGDPATLDDTTKSIFGRFIRKMILYGQFSYFSRDVFTHDLLTDCPSLIYGAYDDAGVHYPVRDPSVPLEKKGDAFVRWVSAYYTPMPDVASLTADRLRARVELPDRIPTLLALPPDQFNDIVDLSTVLRSGAVLHTAEEIHQRNARRAFLNAEMVLPDVDVVALWCDQTPWLPLWGIKHLHDILLEKPDTDSKKREVTFLEIQLEDNNHFVRLPFARSLDLVLTLPRLTSIIGTSLNRWCNCSPKLFSRGVRAVVVSAMRILVLMSQMRWCRTYFVFHV